MIEYHNLALPNSVREIFQSCSKLVISVTEHLVEVVDKLSPTAVVFFRSERILNASAYMGSTMPLSMLRYMLGSVKGVKSENPKGEGKLGNEKGGYLKY